MSALLPIAVRFGPIADKLRTTSADVATTDVPHLSSIAGSFDSDAHTADIFDHAGHHIAGRYRPYALRCSGHDYVARI